MNLIILKIFLLVSLIMVLVPEPAVMGVAFGTSKKGTKKQSLESENVKTRSTNLFYASWLVVYILWALLVVLYCLKPESVNWFWKISPLDNDFIKIFAVVITCLGYYLLMALGILRMRKTLRTAIAKGEKTPLVTSGIFHYTRNPMYLAIDIGVLCTFLLMPNLLTLIMAVGMITILYAVSSDEEKRLLDIYGDEYEKYRNEVGMVFPKLNKRMHKNER